MEKIRIFFIFLFLINLYLSKDDIISFKIETFQSQIENSESNILNKLYNSHLTTTTKVGSNLYPLKTFISNDNHYFYISSNCYIDKSTFSDYKTNFNYDRFNSRSFQNTSEFDLSFSTSSNACTAQESFQLFKVNKMEVTNAKLNFILNSDTDENTPNCLYLGLLENKNPESFFKEYNIITQLKQKSYIKENCWSIIFNKHINYDNDNLLVKADELLNLKGDLYIGDYPHNFDKDNYYESQFIKDYVSLSSNLFKWESKFNKVFYKYNNKEIKILADNNIAFNPSSFLTFVPENYMTSLTDNFFKQFFENGICGYETVEDYDAISCKKSEQFSIEEIKKFPPLFFEHVNLEYTFELSYKDLFIEYNDKYYLLMISDPQYYKDDWILGNTFMRKYQFVFNLESKEIGFYNPNFEEKNNPKEGTKDSSKLILYIALAVALVIIIIGIGIFIKIKFYPSGKKKKRANELDDDFEYESHKNKTDNNNQLFNESINQN